MDISVDALSNHLLGDVGCGPGLLRRVASKVEELTADEGPGYVTSSVMGAGSHRHASDPEIDAEKVMDLAVVLIQFQGAGIGVSGSRVRQQLVTYLRRYRISDDELLLGSPRIGTGHIELVRQRVKALLHEREVPSKGPCADLERVLRAWLDDACDHDFTIIDEAGHTTIMGCAHCDAGYWYDRRDPERWLPVAAGIGA